MKKTYPAKFCPPEIFEINDKHKIVLKRPDISMVDVTIEAIGNPSDLTKINLAKWGDDYRDFWTPLMAFSLRANGLEAVEEFHKDAYIKTARELLAPLKLPEIVIADLEMRIATPWLLPFITWHVEGRKEYVVSPGLTQRLTRTKLKGYPSSSLKMPYGSLYVDLQSYKEFGNIDLEGCMIVDFEDSFAIAVITKGEQDLEFNRMFIVDLIHSTLDLALQKAITRYLEKSSNLEHSKQLVSAWKDLFSFIINVVLYATMPDAETQFKYYDPNYLKLQKRLRKQKSPSKREKIKEQLKKTSKQGVTYLGGSIVVDRTQERTESLTTEGKRKITVRTLVSGHWRDQPCGKNNQGRKRIWIRPFWRGPDEAEITQRPHKLR